LRAHGFIKAWCASNRSKEDCKDGLIEQLLGTLKDGQENKEREALALLEQMLAFEPDSSCKAA